VSSSIAIASAAALLGLAAGCDTEVSAGRIDRCALGAHADPAGGDLDQALVELEELIGRRLDIDRQYYNLDDEVPGEHERWVADGGRTPMFSVTSELSTGEPLLWAEVADPDNPAASALVTGLARRLRDFGGPVFVLFHEQKDPAFGTPAEFAAAWRRLVEVARAEGADNAVWVWHLPSGQFPTEADDWYPGDEWVDWIGASGFNWYNGDPSSSWRPFASVFATFLEWSRGHDRPLMIVSVASAENLNEPPEAPRSKATWIREALAALEDEPRIQALVWNHGRGEDEFRDWRVDSSPAALAAFRELATAPHLDTTATSPP